MEASSGITKRWITNTLIGVIVVLLLFSITLLMITQNYYISTVDLKLNSQYSNSVAAFFQIISGHRVNALKPARAHMWKTSHRRISWRFGS